MILILGFGILVILMIMNIFGLRLFRPGESLNIFIRTYFFPPEALARLIFKSSGTGVTLVDHSLVYTESTYFHEQYEIIIGNWTKFLLYKRWCMLILGTVWITSTRFKRKILFTIVFLIVHQLAIAGGLFMLGILLPKIYASQSDTYLSPTLLGNLSMFILLCIWTLQNREGLQLTLDRLNIKITLSGRTIRESLVALFLFFILREFFIPFFPYKPYVNLLLEITRSIAGHFGHYGEISGDQLVGEYGHLGLSKHCLGFMTMYIFGSLVFLTRKPGSARTTWIFIVSGMVFLMILNIARLVILFILVQGPNGVQKANLHHEIYNVVIYIAIFLLWVLWYEKFLRNKGTQKAVSP